MREKKGELILLTAAILWGTCFVFQKKSMDYVGPYTLGACRFLLGAVLLIPFRKMFQTKDEAAQVEKLTWNSMVVTGGLVCGLALFAAASLQQIGMQDTTAGKAGFITSMEIVLVAAVSVVVTRKIRVSMLVGIISASVGMYLLCVTGGFHLQKGDLFELAGVVFWAVQIIAIDYYVKRTDFMLLSIIQFLVVGLISAVFMILFEHPRIADIQRGIIPILYTGVIEVAVAYTLQIIGQRYTKPFVAAVIMSLESVFAALAGFVFLQENLSVRQLLGCVLMFAAVLISQMKERESCILTDMEV